MFNFIVNFFTTPAAERNANKEHVNRDNNVLFNKTYRNAYNRLWISKLRTYRP